MWKINRLYLKNFVHFYSGMNKREVTLDLNNSNSNMINILVGKMGSGKSSLLGQLQPFSTYGTLDNRNSSPLIIDGEDGIKEIQFVNGDTVYDIVHKYNWSDKSNSHSTKSYIWKNGIELNENGNVRSFKEIIKDEFGIEQNFLKILRLGSNVSNIINMKSTERKGFISSLLEDTEIYSALHSKLSEEYREINISLNILSGQLLSLSADKEEEIERTIRELDDIINDMSKDIDALDTKIKHNEGMILAIMQNQPYHQLDVINNTIFTDEEELIRLQNIVDSTPDVSNLKTEYAELQAKIPFLTERIMITDNEMKSINDNINTLEVFISANSNTKFKNEIERNFYEIKKRYDSAKMKVSHYKSQYSYTYLVDFVNTINSFSLSVEEFSMVPEKDLVRILHSDKSFMGFCNKRLEKLHKEYEYFKRSVNNIKFAETYEEVEELIVPKKCLVKDCPVYRTHPLVLMDKDGKDIRSEVSEYIENMQVLDKEIAKYESYLLLYPKGQILAKSWKIISVVLSNIGALREVDLIKIITNPISRSSWYDHMRLINATELSKTSEEFTSLEAMYMKAEIEMMNLNNSNIEEKKAEILSLNSKLNEMATDLSSLYDNREESRTRVSYLEGILMSINDISNIHTNITVLTNRISDNYQKKQEVSDSIHQLMIMQNDNKPFKEELFSIRHRYEMELDKKNKLQIRYNEIISTKESYDGYLKKRDVLKTITDAVSSKDGIPLVLIKVFLDDCREIINDLLDEIFHGTVEILDFELSEDNNDFKIPFMSNGIFVSDIELASQGQQAIMLIALSFALCRKSMFNYNIMLLDEVDNSIYKTDREKYVSMLFKQMHMLNTSQIFLTTHNDLFKSGLSANIIMTTDEIVDTYKYQNIIRLY